MSDDDELHEVFASYDNLAAVAVGDRYGHPTLSCSCGFRATAPTWEEAGAEFDEHVQEGRE